jgi:hypothetical protein
MTSETMPSETVANAAEITRQNAILAFVLTACLMTAGTITLSAQDANEATKAAPGAASVGQLYFYSIKDRPSFDEGYRRHLSWHAVHNDPLAWYAWTVDAGTRKGVFVDGTFGATFAGLDARIDPSGDGADFVHNVTPYVSALNIETWTLWASPSTAMPLENRLPGAELDVFLLQVDPGESLAFEAAVEKLAKTKRETIQLTWYRAVRGNNLPTYMLLLTRKNGADIVAAGPVFAEMLANAYAAAPAQVADVLRHVRAIRAETWDYEPRLSLIPGHPLEP